MHHSATCNWPYVAQVVHVMHLRDGTCDSLSCRLLTCYLCNPLSVQATQEALSQAVVNLHRILALEHKELCGGGLLPKHAPLADLYGAVSVGDALAHQEVYQDCEAVDTEKEWECCSICFDCPKVCGGPRHVKGSHICQSHI